MPVSRRVVKAAGGVLHIDQRIAIRGRETGTDVSGPACVYAHIRVRRGRVAYLAGETHVDVSGCCDLFLPPFSVVQAVLDRCDVTTCAMAFRGCEGVLQQPALLGAAELSSVRSQADVLRRLRTAADVTWVGRAPAPGPVAGEAKAIIDREYATSLEIGGIARRLQVAPAVLSRVFKASYGIPPVRYRHQVRIMDALIRLAEGGAPIDVFQDVGFDDLTRFYKIFRKVACGPPGSYSPRESRNAKT